MPVTTIHVNRSSGPAAGIKVMLSFAGGGVTSNVYTDSSGKAVISHDGTGTATVFVNGSNKGSIRAPTTESFSI